MSDEKKRSVWFELAVAMALLVLVVAARATLDVPNFKPVMAVALFAGLFFHRVGFAVLVPLGAMLIADQFIGVYQWQVMLVVYLALVAPAIPGALLRKRAAHLSAWTLGGWSMLWALVGAFGFFIATNMAVWVFTPWYESSLGGLSTCFLMALPFLKWTLLGNVTFTAFLVFPWLACRAAQGQATPRLRGAFSAAKRVI